jgi:signal transduction histidine kinase
VFFQSWQKITFFWGLFWSFLYSLILSNIPLVNKLDLYFYDALFRRFPHQKVSPEIVLLKIKEKDLREKGFLNESVIYANLVTQILEKKASVVILNLLPNWVDNSEYTEISQPIKSLINNHYNQLVIVTQTKKIETYQKPEIKIYYNLIPFDSDGNPRIEPETILGFFEYEIEAKKPISLKSSARKVSLLADFIPSDDLTETKTFRSFALLGLYKYYQQQNHPNKRLPKINQLQVNFLDHQLEFPHINIKNGTIVNANNLTNKIVLVGYQDLDKEHSRLIKSPGNYEISDLDFQANILNNLIQNNCYYDVPYFVIVTITIMGVILIIILSIQVDTFSTYQLTNKSYFLSLLLIFFYIILVIINWKLRLILPLVAPIIIWLLTATSLKLYLFFGLQKYLIQQQQSELYRLQSIERKAIISYSQKLLHRIAVSIHDGPLQQLKTIMDNLELIQIRQPNLEELDHILDQLENLGKEIRINLDSSNKLSFAITPELREGLDQGIKRKLTQLMKNKQLILQVNTNINRLEESELNSFWLESREDIFHLFCEAINNVIKHAQPPNGNATYLIVNLSQKQAQAKLEIINDGAKIAPENKSRIKGGYGTKLISIIASELPQGSYKIESSNNIYSVTLTWTMNFSPRDNY